MEISPAEVPWQSIHKLMIGSILPRPIAWVSSVDADGRRNLAPFSYFNAVCANPPHVLFCPTIRSTDRAVKDTLRNVRDTGEFVVNIVSEPLAEAMNLTATEFPPEVDEFEAAGLTAEPARTIKPPRVAESLLHYECRVAQIVDIGDGIGAGSVVIGEVLHLHVSDAVLYGGDKIDLDRLQPIGRLAGYAYCRVTDVFDLVRRPSQVPRRE